MNDDASIAAAVIREALGNILELVRESAAAAPESDLNKLCDEVNTTVLALIAHLITVDGTYDPGEQRFLVQLVDFGHRPNAEPGFLREHSELWRRLERTVPEFFRLAIGYDMKSGTDTARGMMREIQIIANNCSVTDMQFVAVEKQVIKRYLRFLEEHLERQMGGDEQWLDQ